MNIYLDVDGVLLSAGKPANYLDDFIGYLDNEHDGSIYWLTTHCSGSTDAVMAYMKQAGVSEKSLFRMDRFKPTDWPIVKVQAIDFSLPFLWFDDNLLYSEKAILIQNNALENHIRVDLDKNPDSLLVYVQDFPELVDNN